MTRRKFPYEEIAEDATARYLADYEPGERLPSENDMCVHYGVSRMTVRHARELMIKTGRFHVEQGRGMYLVDAADDDRFTRLRGLGDQLAHAAEYALIGGEPADWARLSAAVGAWREARGEDVAQVRLGGD